MWALLAPVVTWILRTIVVKFLILTALFALMNVLVPIAINYVTPFISGGSLSAAFANLDPGLWFFLDFFDVSYGVPLLISAYVARFLIRRIPLVG